MIYRFKKDLDSAIKDYLNGYEKEYNRQVILESFNNNNSKTIETDHYKVTIYFYSGNYERIKITKTEAEK